MVRLTLGALLGASAAVMTAAWWPRRVQAVADAGWCWGNWVLASWDWAVGERLRRAWGTGEK